jgi:TRAP-type mannitol/chloroaromatic compound transport system permease small subunit
MVMARRSRALREAGAGQGYSLSLGYFILVTGGILGLHRFYLKSLLGLIFIPLFIAILFANAQQRDAREEFSNATNIVEVAQGTLEREGDRVAEADATLAELKVELDAAEEGSFAQQSAQRKLERAETRIAQARNRVAQAEQDLARAQPLVESAQADRAFWGDAAFYTFMLILALLLLDALMLPRLKRKAEEKMAAEPEEVSEVEAALEAVEETERKADHEHLTGGWTGLLDRLSYYSGEFVAYWAVIAVFVYYYEVVARYVFNSPTNWAHESMFLMFGMQYLISGAYAMLTEAHVRVDVFYAPMSPRRKALTDLLTSIFFFIFAGTLLVTSWIFAYDATVVQEVSFSEWAIHYWPMKWFMVAGGLLLVLQGISKMAQDLRTLALGPKEA